MVCRSERHSRRRGGQHRLGCTGSGVVRPVSDRAGLLGITASSSSDITAIIFINLTSHASDVGAPTGIANAYTDNRPSNWSKHHRRPRRRPPALRIDDEQEDGPYRCLGRRVSSCRLRASIQHDLGSITSHLVSFASLSERSNRRGEAVVASA